jgi:triosephosphate isomerase
VKNKLFVANFKMNKTTLDLAEYFCGFPKLPANYQNTIVFCVPFTALYYASNLFPARRVRLGVQNIHYADCGAFTGEISAQMVADLWAQYVIIGHSERRAYFHEDDSVINKKIKSAAANDMTVILCVGESKEERAAKRTKDILSRQILSALQGIDNLDKIIIAYEPVWAIGGNKPASTAQINEAANIIHKILPNVPLLYGGSVNEQNANEILSINGVDGVLVGSACLDPVKFAKICGLRKQN